MIKNKQTIHTRHNRRMTTQCPSSLNPPRRFFFKTIDAADQQGSCEWNENSTPSYQYTTKSFNFSMTMSNELAGNKTQYLGLVDNYAIGKFANAWFARRKTFFFLLYAIFFYFFVPGQIQTTIDEKRKDSFPLLHQSAFCVNETWECGLVWWLCLLNETNTACLGSSVGFQV